MRAAKVERKTGETEISISLKLDGRGAASITTGINFFDHMLTQISVHGLFDLDIQAKGDLEIDAHHTVEDCGIALGTAFNEALGTKKGIVRMGSAIVPLDEALSRVVIDFSGRPFCVFEENWSSSNVAGMPVSLIEHFFHSFSVAAGATLHIALLYGRDNHHMAESIFKAFARATRDAVKIDPRRGGDVPSSKGILA